MSKKVQTGALDIKRDHLEEDEAPTVIKVDDVSMAFNIANQQLNSLKEYAIALFHRDLMFKEFRALNNVSFEVKKGDVYGILGTNGSGKSTLLKIIAGILEPSEGTVEIKGKIAPLIEMNAGFDPELTARENIYLNGSLLGHSKKFIEQHFDDIVEFAEIEDFLDMPLKNYSSGMVSRTAFAIATVMVPDILIADEVLAVGDFMFREKCERRIQDLIHNHGVTVLIVSHSIEQIERICNKAIWIEKSHPRLVGDAKDVARIYQMLGGHSGSADAESTVLEVLQSTVPYENVAQRTIASKSKYDTAVDILGLCDFRSADTLLLVNGDNACDKLIALGMGGALCAPVLSIKENEIPSRVKSVMRSLGPRRIVLVQVDGAISTEVQRDLSALDNGDGALMIDEVTGSDLASLSRSAADYLDRLGAEFDVLAALPAQEFDLVTLAPLIYEKGLIVTFGEEGVHRADSSGDPRPNALTLAPDGSDVASVYGSLSRACMRVDGGEWPLREGPGRTEREFVLVSSHDSADGLSAAMYVAQSGAELIRVNHGDLDSIANAIHDIEHSPEPIARITFIGGSFCFNDIDKEIFAKAVARQGLAREEQRS